MHRILIRTQNYQLILISLFVAVGLFLSLTIAFAIFLGGALMAANFWAMRVLLQKIFQAPNNPPIYSIVLLALKLVILLTIVGLILFTLPIHIGGFALGMGSLLVAAAIAALSTKEVE